MSNFPNIITTQCIPTTPPPPDPRCADRAFALANPGICSTTPVLILKPSVLLTCSLGSVQFQTFQDLAGVETRIMSGVIYSSSNPAVAIVSASTGNATGISTGECTISATYQGQTTTASLTVVGTASGGSCCGATTVATMLLVDTSKSMSLAFGGGFATKEDYAKSVATTYANQTNTTKDLIGVMSFDATPTVLVAPTSNIASVTSAIAGLAYTQNQTSIGLALQSAINALAAVTADLKVIVLISDGENEDTVAANDPIMISENWQSPEQIIVCFGVRSSATDNGFNLLNGISTGGFFVNSYSAIATDASTTLDGLKGYICAGNCTPPGNIYQSEGALDYTGFANWNVTGSVDLFGDGFYDMIPGNGLYVNISSITLSGHPKSALTSKTAFAFTAGKTYRLSIDVAGNQQNAGSFGVSAAINGGIMSPQSVTITDYTQDFQTYSFNFTPLASGTGNIVLEANSVLIDNVVLTDVTDLTLMFSDDFDTENVQYVPPACGPGASGSGTNSVPLPANYDTSGFAAVTGLSIGTTYTFTPQDQSGDYCITCGATTLCITGTFTATETTAQLAGFASAPVLDTLTYTGAFYYYGTAGCYGYGCLNSPPGDQMPDPIPLPDIEASFVAPTAYTSTQTVTVYCPNGTVQDDGNNTGATGTATYTSYISQQDAVNNATALATANANANLAQIGCKTQYTSTQTFTAQCPAGQFGSPVTKSATATSFLSQSDADAQALAAATAAANAALSCNGSNNLLPITNIGPVAGAAGTYPSVQTISGMSGLVTKVTLNVNQFIHLFCCQVCVMLRSPSGRTAVIFCGMGGNHTIPSPINLVFDDAAGSTLPAFNTPVSGTFKCSPYDLPSPLNNPSGGTTYTQVPYWPAPAPQPNYGLNLATFIGDNPNGSWSLWVASAVNVDSGSIQSWTVNITSA
jgi:von Willebrand factor type A domain/Bacterial Ig-like domain (group 2)